jgi:hypothetical protein
MAISHIGRVLRDRAERERLKTANNLLEGAATDLPKLHYYQVALLYWLCRGY